MLVPTGLEANGTVRMGFCGTFICLSLLLAVGQPDPGALQVR
jgi:hypothetical protein